LGLDGNAEKDDLAASIECKRCQSAIADLLF